MQPETELLFYDIECFAYDALVVFKDIEKRTVAVYHNDFTGLEAFIKGHTLVGFNNYFYDDAMLHAMIDLKTPAQLKALNDRIISGEKVKIKYYKFDSLDCFQQADPSMPGLKKIEGNLGKMILESAVSFDIDRPLTPEEYQEVLNYCCYDVDTTVDVFKIRKDNYFLPKESLVEMYGDDRAKRWNTTTLSANILMKKPSPKWSTIRVPEELLQLVPAEVADLWLNKEKGNITIYEFDNEINFGFGGLHGANQKKKVFENVVLLDVRSMYPNIIVNHRILGSATEKYKAILDERIRIKHIDQQRQEGLKLILNSVSGNLKSKFSILYNPKANVTMVAIGQIILYDLASRLAPTCEIVQLNTDGVAFIPYTDDYKRVWVEWERDHNLVLEEEFFKKFIQRDVNNYLAVKADGSMKLKGGDVSRFKKDAVFKNNNARIIDIAIVEKLVNKRDVLDTLLDHLDRPHLFQYILQAGGTYAGTFDDQGSQYNKVNRVFASKKDGFCLYKRRHDSGMVRFADAPEKMMLWNQECSQLENFDRIVDLNHYYQIINKKLERWA